MINIECISGGSIYTNCYMIKNNKRIILIDFVPEIINIIKTNNYSVDQILLTHIHYDHFEGLSSFQKTNNFQLCMSEEALNFFKNPRVEISSLFPPEIANNFKNIKIDNVKILEDNDILTWENYNIKILKSPGHSSDSLMYLFYNEKVVFTGDVIFYGSIGRTDLPGGDFNLLINSINKLFSQADDDFILYPGHGPETTIGFEKLNNPFIKNFYI